MSAHLSDGRLRVLVLNRAVRLERAAREADTACRRADLTFAARLLREDAGQHPEVIDGSQAFNVHGIESEPDGPSVNALIRAYGGAA